MKRQLIFFITGLLLIAAVGIAGCTSQPGPSTIPQESPSVTQQQEAPVTPAPISKPASTPEDTFEAYTKAFNRGDVDAAFLLLSSEYQYQKSKVQVSQNIDGYLAAGMKFEDYRINNIDISEDQATAQIEITHLSRGRQYTMEQTISFIRENGAWKLTEFTSPRP